MSGMYFFTGKCKWAMLDKMDEEFRCYKIDLYLDKENLKKFYDSGCMVKIREDDEGTYVTFRRSVDKLLEGMPQKPKKLINQDGEYIPFDQLIGNGSLVTVKVDVYNLKKMKGTGHRLEAVAVEELVPYEGSGQTQDDLPF